MNFDKEFKADFFYFFFIFFFFLFFFFFGGGGGQSQCIKERGERERKSNNSHE